MRTRALLPLLALGLGLGVLAATAAPPVEKPDKPDADKIAKLIVQLGSDDFDEREKASADLEAVGDPAYAALHEALKSTDEEVRKRAELLVGKIEKRRESADALKPKRVHLVYKDTPLTEAVEDLKKQTGYSITLNDPDNKLKDRKVTLDTGDMTFWQALDQFCDKADLQETESASNGLAAPIAVPAPPVFRPRRVRNQPAPGGAVPLAAPPAAQPPPAATTPPPPPPPPPPLGIVVGGPAFPPGVPMTAAPDGITLTDGKADSLPTDASSAVRVQALKPDPNTPAPDGEILIGLRLSIEPRMLFQSVEKVTIRKAVDDQKQELAQTTTDAAPAGAAPGAAPARAGRAVIMPFPGAGVALGAGDVQQDAVVHLKKGEKASKSLSELSGTISAHILTEAAPVITADDIMKVKAGAAFKGGENGVLTIADVAKNPAGQVVIRLELQPPTDSVPVGGANPAPIRRPIRIRPVPLPAPPGGGVAPPVMAGGMAAAIVIGPGGWNAQGAAGLDLLDDKGNVVKQVGSQIQNQITVVNGVGTVTQTYTLTFQPEKDQEPSKLVYMGRKVLSVDVPFTLKDVPLP